MATMVTEHCRHNPLYRGDLAFLGTMLVGMALLPALRARLDQQAISG